MAKSVLWKAILSITLGSLLSCGMGFAQDIKPPAELPPFEFAPASETQGVTEEMRVKLSRAAREPGICRIFVDEATNPARAQRNYTAKPLEPIYGAYLGAFIDREDGVSQYFRGVNGQMHKDVGEFNAKIGKRHASFFMYERYGFEFPSAWFSHLQINGAAAQWVLQPEHLDDVKDDDYLRNLAQETARTHVPVFLRFAGEMNGNWVPYHGDPAKYKEKFRLIARVFHQYAPNVALVWCPNEVPTSLIEAYFPGDDAVDWVGVNFYSVFFANNDPNYPVAKRNPVEALEFVYKKYSARHPIFIGEWGATHQAALDGIMRPDFAGDKIAELYGALPRLFPRVKAVNWFSMNAIKWAPPTRRINNYSLLELPELAARYREMVDVDYFLSHISESDTHPSAIKETVALTPGYTMHGTVTLSAYIRTNIERAHVVCLIAGREVARFEKPGHYRVTIDTTTLPAGVNHVVYEARNPTTGKVLARDDVPVFIGNKGGVARPMPPKLSVSKAAKATPSSVSAPKKNMAIVPTLPGLTLTDLLRHAKSDTKNFVLTVTPSSSVSLGDGFRFTSETATGGWLVLFVDEFDGSRTVLYPGETPDTALVPHTKRSVPDGVNQLLRPNTAGRYIVHAMLLPNMATRDTVIKAVSGEAVLMKNAAYPVATRVVIVNPSPTMHAPKPLSKRGFSRP